MYSRYTKTHNLNSPLTYTELAITAVALQLVIIIMLFCCMSKFYIVNEVSAFSQRTSSWIGFKDSSCPHLYTLKEHTFNIGM